MSEHDEEYDAPSGRKTTGHEWNGIKELDNPIPRVVLFFLAAGALFSLVYWVLMPAFPLGTTFTRGLRDYDERREVTRQVQAAAEARAAWMDRIGSESFQAVAADPALMAHVRETGRTLFADNCAVCHGSEGRGGPGYPDLGAKAWLWGGDPETLAETIRVGINSDHPDTRRSLMSPFGQMGMISREQILDVSAYVRAKARQPLNAADLARVGAGREVFVANCASCHGMDARGGHAFGAPDLTDRTWIHGGDAQSVFNTIHYGRTGHMPHWEGRLSPADIRLLTLYVGTLGESQG